MDRCFDRNRRDVSLLTDVGLVSNQCKDSLVMNGSIHY